MTSIKLLLSLTLVLSVTFGVEGKSYQGLKYLNKNLYPELLKTLPPPPAEGSDDLKKDIRELLEIQKNRTQKDCERAEAQIKIRTRDFLSGAGVILDPNVEKQVERFANRVKIEAEFFVKKLKDHYKRKRPHDYIEGAKPCIRKSKSTAYPSGHATDAYIIALVLTDLYAAQKEALLSKGLEYGQSRVIGGVHHPADVVAGKILAELLHAELLKSEAYLNDLNALKEVK